MTTRTWTLGLTLLGALAGCAQGEPELTASTDKRTIDGTSERAVLTLRASDALGNAGAGTVTLSVGAGAFVDGSEVALVDGVARATFRCDPTEDPACNGDVRIGATWKQLPASVVVRVGGPVRPEVRWRLVPTGVTADLLAAAAAPDGSTWAVGTGGTVIRLAHGAWVPVPSGTTADLRAVWASATSVYVAGKAGTVLRWDGRGFTALAADPKDDFTAAWGSDDTHVFLTTAAGSLYGCDAATLTLLQQVGARLEAVSGRGDEVWAAGDGLVLRLAGDGSGPVVTPVPGQWTSVLARADGVWLGGARADGLGNQQGAVLLGPAEWRASQVSPEAITAIAWSDSSVERFAVSATEVYRKVGDELWVATRAPAGGRALAGHSADDVVVVGDLGTAIQRVP